MTAAGNLIETTDARQANGSAKPNGVGASPAKDGDRVPAPSPAAAKAEAENLNLLGQAVWLLGSSPQHRHMFLADLEWRVRPPIVLRQCRLFKRQNRPFALVTWAYVSDEVAGRLQAAPGRLKPEEWRCGKRPVIIDVVAPFGDGERCVRDVVRTVFEAAKPAAPLPSA